MELRLSCTDPYIYDYGAAFESVSNFTACFYLYPCFHPYSYPHPHLHLYLYHLYELINSWYVFQAFQPSINTLNIPQSLSAGIIPWLTCTISFIRVICAVKSSITDITRADALPTATLKLPRTAGEWWICGTVGRAWGWKQITVTLRYGYDMYKAMNSKPKSFHLYI